MNTGEKPACRQRNFEIQTQKHFYFNEAHILITIYCVLIKTLKIINYL